MRIDTSPDLAQNDIKNVGQYPSLVGALDTFKTSATNAVLQRVDQASFNNISYGPFDATNVWYVQSATTPRRLASVNERGSYNVFGFACKNNRLVMAGRQFGDNVFDDGFENNEVIDATNCEFGNSIRGSVFGANHEKCVYGPVGINCQYGADHFDNQYGVNHTANTYGTGNKNNRYGNNLSRLVVGNNVTQCTVGDGCTYVKIGNDCSNVRVENCAGTAASPFVIPDYTYNAVYRDNALVTDPYDVAAKSVFSYVIGDKFTHNIGESAGFKLSNSQTTAVTYQTEPQGNFFKGEFGDNTYGDNLNFNDFEHGCLDNRLGNTFQNNRVGRYFSGNTFAGNTQHNVFGNDQYGNRYGTNFTYNTVENGVNNCDFGANVTECRIGRNAQFVTVGDNCKNVTLINCKGTDPGSGRFTVPAGSQNVTYVNNVLTTDPYGIAGKLDKAANLSDLQDKAVARQNLGIVNQVALSATGGLLSYNAATGVFSTSYTAENAANRVSDFTSNNPNAYPSLAATKSYVDNATTTSAKITDFTEAVQDAVAGLLGAGSNIALTYNDAANTFTIAATGVSQFDPEATRDAIGAALIGVGNIAVVINDAADTITISTTATANSTDAQLRDRATHTGTQAANTISEDATHRFTTDTEKAVWNSKQAALTFDGTPTSGSANPVTSGGVFTALSKTAPKTQTFNNTNTATLTHNRGYPVVVKMTDESGEIFVVNESCPAPYNVTTLSWNTARTGIITYV